MRTLKDWAAKVLDTFDPASVFNIPKDSIEGVYKACDDKTRTISIPKSFTLELSKEVGDDLADIEEEADDVVDIEDAEDAPGDADAADGDDSVSETDGVKPQFFCVPPNIILQIFRHGLAIGFPL